MNVFKTALVSLTLILIAITSCKEPLENVGTHHIQMSKDSLSVYIEKQFSKWTVMVCQDELPYMDTLKSLYKNENYESMHWDALIGDSASWVHLEQVFAHSKNHGMDHRYYYLPLVDYYRKKAAKYSTADSMYRVYAELELIISNSLLRMYDDIANGRTNPKEVYGYTYMLPRNNWQDIDYEGFLKDENKIEAIDQIHDNDTTYNELKKLLKAFLNRKDRETSTAINFADYPKIVVGDTAPVIPLIIAKMKKRNIPDSAIQQVLDTNVYLKDLRVQIKRLQEKYSLTPDGIMGYKTYKLINSTPTEKIDQIKANLERQRWFDKHPTKPYVYINLPTYLAEMHWEDSAKTMKVCIGKNLPDNYDAMVQQYTDSGWLHKLPKNMETPQIASKISYMVVNPTWTIPYSIIKREMWWKLVKDPTYLSRNGYKVFRGKTEVDGDTIQWSKVNKNRIPYQIVQNPGPKNSLGTVKYMFNNPFSIYLHDTPSKGAFNRTQRAVSHGCVRLQYPVLFGEYLTQNIKKYDADDFRIMMGYPPKDKDRLKGYDPADSTALIQKLEETTIIRLNKSIPLYLDYRTIYYDKEWRAHYAYDIYDQNKLILQEMDRM